MQVVSWKTVNAHTTQHNTNQTETVENTTSQSPSLTSMVRYFSPTKVMRKEASPRPPAVIDQIISKDSVNSSYTEMSYSEDTSITTEQSLQRQQRRRQRRSLSIASAVKGRVLAPGSFVGTNLWQLSRHSRGRGLLGQLRGENVVIRAFSAAAEEQHPQQKQHSEYHCQLRRNADNFVVRNAAGKAILQCITTTTNTATAAGSHNDNNNNKKKSSLSILYGTRPLIAGNPATHRAHGGQFYPWYVVAMGSDGGVTVELYNAKQAVLWSSCGGCSEESAEDPKGATQIRFQSTLFDDGGGSTAAEVTATQPDGPCNVTIQPGGGADPGVMIAIALLLSKM